MTEPGTSSSIIPVQPLVLASSARYSSDCTPTDDALTRSGRSFVTKTTLFPSPIKFLAIAKIRESLVPSRKNPAGRVEVSEWFSSTFKVPPCSFNLIARSKRPLEIRRSSKVLSAARAK